MSTLATKDLTIRFGGHVAVNGVTCSFEPGTLTAICERVLYTAAEQHPFVSLLQVDASGPQCEPLHQGLPDVEPDQLASGLRLVLVDFLTVLGNLTAEILTPALHAELSKVALEDGGVNANESQAGPPNNESNGEGSQP